MKTQNEVVQVRKKGDPPGASFFRSKWKHIKSFLFEARKDTNQRCPFCIVRESFHGGRSFGSVIAALVAGDCLPSMYPNMRQVILLLATDACCPVVNIRPHIKADSSCLTPVLTVALHSFETTSIGIFVRLSSTQYMPYMLLISISLMFEFLFLESQLQQPRLLLLCGSYCRSMYLYQDL